MQRMNFASVLPTHRFWLCRHRDWPVDKALSDCCQQFLGHRWEQAGAEEQETPSRAPGYGSSCPSSPVRGQTMQRPRVVARQGPAFPIFHRYIWLHWATEQHPQHSQCPSFLPHLEEKQHCFNTKERHWLLVQIFFGMWTSFMVRMLWPRV